MLQLNDVILKRGDRAIFEEASLTIHPGHSAGIVGRNGVGKTTLFDLIRRRLQPEEGDVAYPHGWRIAWLDQAVAPSDRHALDFAVDGDRSLRQIEARIVTAEAKGDDNALAHLYTDLEDAGGYDVEARAGEILHGLGFIGSDFKKPHKHFSGGWRIRLNLARTLMTPSDLLLLDEPTNHLDLDATLWLEAWLKRYEGTLLVIAHDRDFLDAVTGEIVHVTRGKTLLYTGNYSSYQRQRASALIQQSALFKKQQLEVGRIHKFVDRFRAKATKARQVQSRLKALERMELVAPVHAESPYQFAFSNPRKVSNPIITMDAATMGYDESLVLDNIKLRIYPGDRIGILGANGAGKTTLLKVLAGDLNPIAGEIMRGRHSSVGYFSQHQMETLDGTQTALQTVLQGSDTLREQHARDYLGGWGFSNEMTGRPISTLSGGERARLVLALIALTKPAVLLLDEPTNHLDIEMREALAVALQEYDGALVLVSHDRHLLRQCVDQLWIVQNGSMQVSTKDLDAYTEVRQVRDPKPMRQDKQSERRQKAQHRKRLQPLRQKSAELERAIEETSTELDELSTKLSNSDTYLLTSKEKINDLLARQGTLKKRLTQVETEWLYIQEQLEAQSN